MILWDDNSGVKKVLGAGKDVEGGNSGGVRSAASFIPLKAMPGKWEAVFVWTLSFFFSFWVLVRFLEPSLYLLF